MNPTLEPPPIETPKTLNSLEIMEIIPHRYPFLMVDRVTELIVGSHIKGYKNLTVNEPFFQGHFPGNPIMPGVLMVEALAQIGSILVSFMPEGAGKIGLFAGINDIRFRRPVVPGDQLDLYVEILKIRSTIGKARGEAKVNGEMAASGEIMFSLVPKQWKGADQV